MNNRDTLAKELFDIANRKSFTIQKINVTPNNNYFFLKKGINDSNFKLYYKENDFSKHILLYDPKNFKANSKNKYVINYIKPSWDGKYVVIALSYSGLGLSDMIIYDVKNKKIMPQILNNAWPSNMLGVNWLPNNSGFIYLKFRGQ